MFGFINKMFGSTPSDGLKEEIEKGAILIDVRTREEFNGGHVKISKNIPLDEIENSIDQLNKEKTYVLVCASGIRSRNAMNILKKNGFINVHNGGSWTSFL